MTKSNNLLADYAAKKQDICIKNDTISDSLFREYGVNRGLRDVNGKGVLTGLTNISEIVSFKTGEDGSSCLLYTSPSPRDGLLSRMPSSA